MLQTNKTTGTALTRWFCWFAAPEPGPPSGTHNPVGFTASFPICGVTVSKEVSSVRFLLRSLRMTQKKNRGRGRPSFRGSRLDVYSGKKEGALNNRVEIIKLLNGTMAAAGKMTAGTGGGRSPEDRRAPGVKISKDRGSAPVQHPGGSASCPPPIDQNILSNEIFSGGASCPPSIDQNILWTVQQQHEDTSRRSPRTSPHRIP